MDITQLKLSEVAEVEKLSKQSFSNVADLKAPKGLVLQALAFVIGKRDNPKYTFAEAGELTFDEANKLLLDEADADPLEKK